MAQTPQSEETGGAGETTTPGAGRGPGLFGGSTTILLLILAVAVFWWNRRRRIEIEERLRAERREADAVAQRSALDVAHLMRAGSRPAVDSGHQDTEALEIERAEARAAAERTAEEEAQRASRDAEIAGESAMRRAVAASAAAEEAEADTVEAALAGQVVTLPAGAVLGDGTASCPPDYPIKGNRQSRIYHTPGQVSYPSTIAEYCFASPEAAELAGFRVSRSRGQRPQQ